MSYFKLWPKHCSVLCKRNAIHISYQQLIFALIFKKSNKTFKDFNSIDVKLRSVFLIPYRNCNRPRSNMCFFANFLYEYVRLDKQSFWFLWKWDLIWNSLNDVKDFHKSNEQHFMCRRSNKHWAPTTNVCLLPAIRNCRNEYCMANRSRQL